MKQSLAAIQAWFAGHPAVKGLLDGAVKVALITACTMILAQTNQTNAQMIDWAGIGIGVLAALKVYAQHSLDTFLLGDASTTPAAKLQSSAPVCPACNGSGTVAKAVLLAIGLAFMVSPAFAGYLMSPEKSNKLSLSLPTGTALYLMPIEGFEVGGSLPKPTYGLSFNEDIVWGGLSALNGAPNFAPIFGLGASLYLDGSEVINGNGPLLLMGGLNLLGPDLDLLGLGNGQGLVPNVLFTENFVTGETRVTGGLTVFADLGPGTAQKIAGQ